MKTTLFLTLFLVCSLSASTLHLAISSNPSRINPILSTDSASSQLTRWIFSALVTYDKEGVIVPELAQSYAFKDDTTLIFKLKEDVRWSDGHPFSADDVLFTYDMSQLEISLEEAQLALDDLKDTLADKEKEKEQAEAALNEIEDDTERNKTLGQIRQINLDIRTTNRSITEKGREIIKAMESLHMIVDTSHLNDEGTREILMTCHVAPMASHSDARAVTGHRRNLPDDLIRLFGEKGGLIGLNFANHFTGTEDVTTLDNIVRHARHIRDVGGIDVLALGSDFDGIEPKLELKDASEMGRLAEALKKGGFKEEEIEKIFWWNGERYLEDVLR